MFVAAGFLFTDARPLVEQPAPPDAEQASAVKMAVGQLRGSDLPGKAAPQNIHLTSRQLEAAGALASDAFKPDRLLVELDGDRINITGSHKLPFGRWLNAGLVGHGSRSGFPKVYLTVGSVSFPAGISRTILEGARRAVNWRGAAIPPLDRLVQRFEIKGTDAIAVVQLPPRSGIVDQLAGGRGSIEARTVLAAYCKLTALQSSKPTDDLAEVVRRAFPAGTAGTATVASNRAAYVAIAMFVVSPRVGDLIGLSDKDIEDCGSQPVAVKLHGRFDLPQHWSLSAALAVTSGTQISQAMGEWKELADSVSRQSQFAVGDPTGFSFLDIAADRSGFLIAQDASDPDHARSAAIRMSRIGQDDILPPSLMTLEDGLPESVFVRKYGSIRDPRFLARIRQIDEELNPSAPR